MGLLWNRRRVVLAAAGLSLANRRALAQDATWPTRRPVTWLVGFAAGGALDVISRLAAERLARRIGQSVVIDNRVGGTGAVAAQAAASAAPDGYTLVGLPGPILYARPVPRIGRELKAVTLLARGPMVIAGAPDADVPDLRVVLARARSTPDRWSFGTAGVGSSHHFVGELVNERAGTRIVHVPYRGGAQAVTDAVGRQIPLVILGAGPLLPHIRSGALRAYAVTTATRFPGLPDVPTLAEQGFDGVDLAQWFGLATTAGVPEPIVTRLVQEVGAVLGDSEVAAACLRQGMVAAPSDPAVFETFFVRENDFYGELQRRWNVTLE